MPTFSRKSPLKPPLKSPLATERLTRRELLYLAAAGGGLFALGNCAPLPPPFVPINYRELRIVHCFDGVPHQPGSKPWILGGTCCCTPNDELIEIYHREQICLEYSADDLIELHRRKNIKLIYDHTNCNNLCEFGPHVTKGGRCMVPPTPGTRNYEEIVAGIRRA